MKTILEPARDGETILDAAHRAGIDIASACGGRGTCRSCMVHVPLGHLHDPSPSESRLIAEGRMPPNWRQACQARMAGPCEVEIPQRARARAARTEVGGGAPAELPLDPLVTAAEVEMTPPRQDDAADADRLATALGRSLRFDLAAARDLPRRLRAWKWRARAALRSGELIALRPAGKRLLGLAVDLGTTNIAGFLVDLESGELLGTRGAANPQGRFGADVISRMAAAHATETMAQAAAATISELAAALTEGEPEGVVDVVVAGNTAMHHLLLGLPADWLGRVPFVPALSAGMDVKARELGIAVAPGAWVHLLPNIAGFVGGDHVAALLATEELWRDGTSLLLDIGTNTEISVITDGRIVSASCPSGPAFEGGHIACGMRAAAGAIEKVRVVDGRIEAITIDDAPPVGICGSGVIDAVAVLHEAGLIDARGRVRDKEVALAEGVVLTQHDVRALQVAKAAVRSACDLLLTAAGKTEAELDRVIIAGAFGSYIDLGRAIRIGMLPDLAHERFAQVGNAAGIGARMALASRTARKRAAEIAAQARHLALASDKTFMNSFMRRINLD